MELAIFMSLLPVAAALVISLAFRRIILGLAAATITAALIKSEFKYEVHRYSPEYIRNYIGIDDDLSLLYSYEPQDQNIEIEFQSANNETNMGIVAKSGDFTPLFKNAFT